MEVKLYIFTPIVGYHTEVIKRLLIENDMASQEDDERLIKDDVRLIKDDERYVKNG